MPDDLEWDEDTYQPVAGRAGVVTEVEGGYSGTVTVRIKELDMQVTVPARSVSLPPSATPSTSCPSPTASDSRQVGMEDVVVTAVEKGCTATVSSDAAFVKREVGKFPEDLEWDNATYNPIIGVDVKVEDINDGMADVVTTTTPPVHATVPLSVLTPASLAGRATPPGARNGKGPASPPKVTAPLSTGPCRKEFTPGMRVSIQQSKQVLKSMVGFFPEDIEWDEEEVGSCAGQTAEVVGVEGELLDLKVEKFCRQITLPKKAVEVLGEGGSSSSSPMGRKAPPGSAPPGAVRKGDNVTITGDRSKLQTEVRKFPDDIEWDNATYLPALGAKGSVVGIDGKLVDVALTTGGAEVTVPMSCIAGSGAVPPPSLVGPKSSFAHQSPSSSEYVNLISDKETLQRLLPQHANKAGFTGRIVSFKKDSNMVEVLLEKTKEQITVPAEALQKPAKWPAGSGHRKTAAPGGNPNSMDVGKECTVRTDPEAVRRSFDGTSLTWNEAYRELCGKTGNIVKPGPEITEMKFGDHQWPLPTKALVVRKPALAGSQKVPHPTAPPLSDQSPSKFPKESSESTGPEKQRLCCTVQ
eukprot:TRINITY_DN28044_c0_g1_i1.p1 TRINITY_DN28044_c0_g1~~TRINITY_DN28044_c0_g1_i1.p1  ORF type:complete len:623 (+),score=199.54 TRINITY_DN28044_c0_g1_i1:129-1871(+)